jgi:gliding motility-associated-like protein
MQEQIHKKVRLLLVILSVFYVGSGLQGQCGTAYLSSDYTTICVPNIVKFKVKSFPVGTTFEWDLGSGYVNSDSTYTKLFATAGDYNIRIKLKYLDGSTCILNYPAYVKAKPVPVPQYTISRNVICKYDDSLVLTDVTPGSASRDWLVENTLYPNGPKSLKTYFNLPSGYKYFTLFMKDSFGCEGKKTFDNVIYVTDSLSVNFAADKVQGCLPKGINFNNLTDTLGNEIASWKWSFPGASPSSSTSYAPKNILYNTRDTFDVSLIVTTKRGCVYEHVKKNYLKFADSIILNTSFSQTTLCGHDNMTITLNNSRSSKPFVEVTPNSHTLTTIDSQHYSVKFHNFGRYSAYIYDVLNGCKSEKFFNNTITVNGPIARIHVRDQYSCLRPDSLVVVDSSHMNIGVGKTLRWDLFYDSIPNVSLQTGTTPVMKFNCSQYAKYTVRLIVTGNNGCVDTAIKKSALEIKKILPSFTYLPNPSCPKEKVQFTNTTGRGTSKIDNRYRWTFYNLNNGIIKVDSGANPSIIYADSGKYTVKLLAYNILGCRDSITFVKKVSIARPTPKFEVSDTNVCFKQKVRFKAAYKDSSFYTTYFHKWLFQHADSVNQKFTYSGDSIDANLIPGQYKIRYTRYSVRNTCYDTFDLKIGLKVSGASYKTIISPIKGCNPFTSNLEAKLQNNYNFRTPSTNPITVKWTHFYDTNYLSIRQRTVNPTKVFVKKSGKFTFDFSFKHPSGCNDSFTLGTLVSGVISSFIPNNNQYYACVDKPLRVFNFSDPDAIAFKWFIKDSTTGYSFLPSDTAKTPKVLFKKSGVYKLGLIAFGNGNCNDTTYGVLYVNNIKAQFQSADTLNYCAPIIARVSATTHPAIFNYKWYLGDGDSITNNLSTFGHLYKANTGPDGSDVKLIVNGYGCSDTLEKKGFIKVIGPIPKFRLTNQLGCETLNVNFINESKYYRRFFLEYGDGSVLDSINFNKHAYKIFDRSLPFQKFKPVLSVIDTFGCFVQYQNDSVTVFKSPEADFTVNRDTGCSLLSVTFVNMSIGANPTKYRWDFDGNGTTDHTGFSPKYNYPAGDFAPRLMAQSDNGCEDTARNIVFIKSYARPNVTFTTNTDTVCYNGPIDFKANNSPSNSDIVRWEWDFGDLFSFTDTSTRQNPTFNFKRISLSQVSLKVTDKHSCTDTSDRFVYVYDTLGPKSSPMNYVTVTNNKDIDVNWSKSKFTGFKSYNLFNDNSNYTLLYSTPDINDTTYKVTAASGINVNNSRYCYVIKTKDQCNNLGGVTFSHCTVYLQVSDTSVNDLMLDWLSYDGWGGSGNVARYRIYRSENGGPFKLYDSTTATTYKDKKLCNKNYCYYVVAVQKGGRWLSRSNTVCMTPQYTAPSEPVNSIRTTVLPDGRTYTQWEPYTKAKNINNYFISKVYDGRSEEEYYASVDSTGFIDNASDLNTNTTSYTYTVRVNDHCNNESPKSKLNKTILLTGKSAGYVAKVQWTEYEKWHSGIKRYEVYVREDNSFKMVGVDSSKNLYEFNFLDGQLDDSICFRVKAIKDTSIHVESVSNMLCLISDAKVWVPNAFSPNKDGHNDVFIPNSILIFNNTGNPILDYRMEVYNRWGEMVFVSDDAKMGWDGTYQGKPCQQGQYIYKVRALSLDGITSFNIDGILILLR